MMRHLFRNYRLSAARLVRTTATQTPPACEGRCNEWRNAFDSRMNGIESRFRGMERELGCLESRLQTTMTKAVRTRENLMKAASTMKNLENMIKDHELAQKTAAEKSVWTLIKERSEFSEFWIVGLLICFWGGCIIVGKDSAKENIDDGNKREHRRWEQRSY